MKLWSIVAWFGLLQLGKTSRCSVILRHRCLLHPRQHRHCGSTLLMSLDLANPSGSSGRSFPEALQARDGPKDSTKAESSLSGGTPNDSAESNGSRWEPRLESVLHRTPNGHRVTRSYGYEPDINEELTSTSKRSSGGFLLDSASPTSRLAFLSGAKHDASNSMRRKGRDGSGFNVSKRKDRHSHRSSIGSSPLASKVSTLGEDGEMPVGSTGQDGAATHHSLVSGTNTSNNSASEANSQIRDTRQDSTRMGYDTDPVQIVNMALTLSEGRRRQASAVRMASGEPAVRRSISTNQGTVSGVVRPQSNLAHYLNSERQFSRNISLRSSRSGQPASTETHIPSRDTSGAYPQSEPAEEEQLYLQDGMSHVSEATFARVQKAKDHFDLSYEHRRLLAHLPPLRGPAQTLQNLDIEGRAYNPLQYVRDRKVRFQEKSVVSDAEGWHDVQQVRAWVNAIIERHTERRTNPDQCIRLPELEHLRTEANPENTEPIDGDSASSITRKRDANRSERTRRPRSDWVISPGDMLADIYWLEQGMNKTKIEDRDGNKIYPRNTELKYTGWRNRTPAHGPGEQQSLVLPETTEDSQQQISLPAAPRELPTFSSTGRKGKHRERGRGRWRESRPGLELDSEKSDTDSPKRRKRLKRTLIHSFSRSSSSDLDDEKSSLARMARLEKGQKDESSLESKAIDHNMRKMLDRDGRHLSSLLTTDKPRSSIERNLSAIRTHLRHDSPHSSSRERAPSKKRKESDQRPESFRDSLDERRIYPPGLDAERRPRSSLDDDTTAPSSPSVLGFPSIAINLSPPPSRSPSPTKKGLHSRINPFRDRNHSKQRNGIDAADFAEAPPSPLLHQRSCETERDAEDLFCDSREASPMTKTARRPSQTSATAGDFQRIQRTDSKTSVKNKNTPDTPARIRGFFKGGRIAELVGNEVSRVGGFIWKREIPSANLGSSTASSVDSPRESETDEDGRLNGNLLKKSPQSHSRRVSTAEGASKNVSSNQAGAEDKPSYFMSNLPNFTSPFQKNREMRGERERAAFFTPESSPPNPSLRVDHISRAAAHHRSVSKSSRFDQLAPPKLNISHSISPTGSPERHRGNYDFGKQLSLAGPINASRGPPINGLADVKPSRSGTDLTRNWDSSSTIVTKKDIARARALLLSSGTKARQISLHFHSTRPQPPQFLLNTIPSPPSPSALATLHVPRKDELALASHNLISTLTSQTATIRTCISHFTSTTCPSLHFSLQHLDDLVEKTLVPRVRTAADESGELSMKLTTTSTLAVKGLNDAIDGAMRRRRRGPLRWARRVGYVVVEWLVVGLLWGIWLVVSVVRVVVDVGRGVGRVVRWLVWLD